MADRTLPAAQEDLNLAARREGKVEVAAREFLADVILGEMEQRAIEDVGVFSFVGTKEWIKTVEVLQRIEHQRTLRTFVTRTFGWSLLGTFVAIFLQGLGVLHLDAKLLVALGTATVGQIAGLVTLVVKNAFRN